jgi:hypothetical protein
MTTMQDKAKANGAASKEAAEKIARTVRVDELRANGWKVDLPDGQHATMRDPLTITEGQRRSIKESGATVQVLNGRMDDALAQGNLAHFDMLVSRAASALAVSDHHVVALCVETWSYDLPVPSPGGDLGGLRQIPALCYTELLKVSMDLAKVSFPDLSPTPPSVDSPFPAESDLSTPS